MPATELLMSSMNVMYACSEVGPAIKFESAEQVIGRRFIWDRYTFSKYLGVPTADLNYFVVKDNWLANKTMKLNKLSLLMSAATTPGTPAIVAWSVISESSPDGGKLFCDALADFTYKIIITSNYIVWQIIGELLIPAGIDFQFMANKVDTNGIPSAKVQVLMDISVQSAFELVEDGVSSGGGGGSAPIFQRPVTVPYPGRDKSTSLLSADNRIQSEVDKFERPKTYMPSES